MCKAKHNKEEKKGPAPKAGKIKHKPLGEKHETGGFLCKQVKREGDLAIFSKERIKKPWCNHYQAGFEVIIIKRHNGYHLGNQYIEPAETYPPHSLWGILGWTCTTIEEAEIKFNQVKHKLAERLAEAEAEPVEVESE